MDTDTEVDSQTMVVRFPDPLRVINLRFRVRKLRFQAAGTYLFALMVGDEEIAVRRVRVYEGGESS